jgi:hypothetical protein
MRNHIIIFIAASLYTLGSPLRAAAPATIQDVRVFGPNLLQVVLSTGTNSDPAACHVLPSKTEGELTITSCKLDANGKNVVDIVTQETLDPRETYIVVLRNMTFDKPGVSLTGQTTSPKPAAAGPPCVLSHIRDVFTGSFAAAGSGSTPDFSFTGQTTHSAGGSFQGTYSIATNLSVPCGIGRIGPSLNLQGGNDPNGSPDSLNFSFLWDAPLLYSPGPFQSIHLIQAATLESTQDFLQKDVIYSLDLAWRFKPRINANKTASLSVFPDTGLETGKNIRSVIPGADGRGIARVKVGANEFATVHFNKPWIKSISLNTTWTRRWPLIGEVAFKTNKAGASPQFLPVGVGTGPRDYVKPSFALALNDYFSLTASYEYGSLPPKYSLINSKFTFGVTIKANFAGSNNK